MAFYIGLKISPRGDSLRNEYFSSFITLPPVSSSSILRRRTLLVPKDTHSPLDGSK